MQEDQASVGKGLEQRRKVLHELGRLQDPGLARLVSAEPAIGLEQRPELTIESALVGGFPPACERRHPPLRLELGAAEGEAEQAELLLGLARGSRMNSANCRIEAVQHRKTGLRP